MKNFIPALRYAWATLRHKYFVFVAGRKTGVSWWRLLIHDLSKFGPAEMSHYGRSFYGDKSDPDGFARAWLHHQNVNPHHWEYWIPRTARTAYGTNEGGATGDDQPLPMPMPYVREMVADWLGAARSYDGAWPKSRTEWKYLNDRFPAQLRLHPQTVADVETVLGEYFGNGH